MGMSGGVDSSSAAALLIEQGYEVIGVTLKVWPQDCVSRAEDKCCGPQAVMDARSVCHNLGIPYYLIDESEEFQNQVIQYFADEYKAGRTPNPCVMCNDRLKFGTLISRADKLGAWYIATGHYSRIEESPETGRMHLLKGKDPRKDQSYFLFTLKQDQLRRSMMPLGHMVKAETRDVARTCGLKTADKEESQEICFVPDNDYGGFLQKAGLVEKHQGDIVDKFGKKLGSHNGIEFYTVGQRKGLGLTSPKPLYVLELNAETNQVVVGDKEDLDRQEFEVQRCNWIPWENPPAEMKATIKVRYNHAGSPGTLYPGENGLTRVVLDEPHPAITPGQACVFYQEDLVLGGGWIGHHKSMLKN